MMSTIRHRYMANNPRRLHTTYLELSCWNKFPFTNAIGDRFKSFAPFRLMGGSKNYVRSF